MTSPSNSTNEIYCHEMVRVAETFLPLKRWGFKQGAFLALNIARVIYDSEWCRIMFLWNGSPYFSTESVGIYYGRLHAPNDNFIMTWKGERRTCWQRVDDSLNFLDGLSPQEAANQTLMHGLSPRIIGDFMRLDFVKDMPLTEWEARLHSAIWEHYGQKLFELFDLRHPELWEKYTQFVREFHKVLDLDHDFDPPPDKIC